MLSLEHVSAGYGAITVIPDLSLHVGEGETVALLGPNGAGKSTLTAAIAGALRRRAGTIRFDGKDLVALPPHQVVEAGVVLVPEGRRIFAPLTVGDNLRLGAMRLEGGAGALGRQLDYVFGLFPRLAERRGQIAGTLSGGEQQMLAIGRALMSAPRLLLLDEPFLGLAPLVVVEILKAIQGLQRESLTVLLVEQKVEMALSVSDRAYVMVKGSIVREGPSRELLAAGDLGEHYLLASVAGGDAAR
jgi:branched-chain amino acid transport system ATP-binding protein